VESNGRPGTVKSTTSCLPTECAASKATVSSEVNPASAIRDSILSTEPAGDGTRPGGEADLASGRPVKNWSRGDPGQLESARAPAN
jgi:hypothetical protein